jgi:5S rRNA maturation endonuclease (ribonuclease M5)
MHRDYNRKKSIHNIQAYQNKLESIESILDELLNCAQQGSIIIVEGLKDARALNNLGINGDFELATHQTIIDFCEKVARQNRSVIILTDWDRRGNLLEEKLVRIFRSLDLIPDVKLRKKLSLLVKSEIKDVEGLPSYVLKLRQLARSTE